MRLRWNRLSWATPTFELQAAAPYSDDDDGRAHGREQESDARPEVTAWVRRIGLTR